MTNIGLYCFASYHLGVTIKHVEMEICMLTTSTNEKNN